MFTINNIEWDIAFVPPSSKYLKRSDGSKTVGVTDRNVNTIFLSDRLQGAFLRKVLAHELAHCFCFSYSIFIPIDEEERLADWISLYGADLIYLLDELIPMLSTKIA